MKRAIIAAAAISISALAWAQTSAVRVGVRAAWDLTVPSSDITTITSASGFSVGPTLTIPVYKGLYVEPGVSFFFNTMDISYLPLEVNHREVGADGVIRNIGLRAPVDIGWRFTLADGLDFSVYTGAAFNYGLKMKAHYDDAARIGSYNASMRADVDLYRSGWRKFDVQLLAGIKCHYQDHFFAEISTGFGLNNIISDRFDKDSHLRRNTFSLGIGYTF